MSGATRFSPGPFQPVIDEVTREANIVWAHLSARPEMMANIGWAALIFVITWVVSGMASDAVKRTSRRLVHKDGDRTLLEFFSQVVRWLILAVGLVAVLNRLGVQTASLLTVLGAASLAIGLALQGTLGNVAAGLMILFNKPYRIGDLVSVGEVKGTVHRLGLFSTEINNGDNVRVFIPNTKVFTNEIYNITTNAAMKIEIPVDVAYGSDLRGVLDILAKVAHAQPERLSTHDPVVGLAAFAPSGITAKVAIWVMPNNANTARTGLMIDIKSAFDAAGIEIPYPHQVSLEKH
ncbi:mechanosensitive ion channel family protein [Asticcacaulis sp. 201]|uniref:mechanosensitive ion channel family protein n=1 Tax=Asticcacaulis sp. 201 TaxID=3028787 RepID=UPI002916F69C|nr:mechanosensitive ion channel family protein [Asticcacaulis sp. 201]MDV6333019.1 mechanosensitive ion channel family protein [Asticcacaulis sp. 201]